MDSRRFVGEILDTGPLRCAVRYLASTWVRSLSNSSSVNQTHNRLHQSKQEVCDSRTSSAYAARHPATIKRRCRLKDELYEVKAWHPQAVSIGYLAVSALALTTTVSANTAGRKKTVILIECVGSHWCRK